MSLDRHVSRYDGPLEAELEAALQAGSGRAPDLLGMLRYHLGWADASLKPVAAPRGKRIRPILCLLACEACGGEWRRALPAAAAVELLHNFSLIHDDIEDGDRKRRGRPALWALWGVAQAINAGDALFAISQLTMLKLADTGASMSTVHQAMRLFNATCLAITEGQHLDIGFERRFDVAVSEYVAMVEGKTAALVAAACELGAIIALSNGGGIGMVGCRRFEQMRCFGRHLGLSFQMQDDVLGIWGESTVTGKPAGADLVRRKKSLPILHGLERSEELRSLLRQDTLSETHVILARQILDEVGSRNYAEVLARQHYARASACLDAANLVAAPAAALRELAHSLLGREQ